MISIYNYEDPINYISDYIDHLKENDKGFSFSKWSKGLKFKNNITLIDILKRKKSLKGKSLELLLKGLPIDESEKMFFQAMAERANSTDNEKIKMYDLIMKELNPSLSDQFTCFRDSGQLDVFSHWIYMAILSMANFENFEMTADNISNVLCEDLDDKIVEDALFVLFEKGFLIKKENVVECRYKSLTTKTNTKSENISQYYTLICDLAKNAIDLSPDRREFQCFCFAMPEERLPLAKEIIRKARIQITSLESKRAEENNIIYQGNIMLFPLTKNIHQK